MDQNVLLPVRVEAFVFNKAVCNGYDDEEPKRDTVDYRIAPITQPNYSFVQLDENYLQPDLTNNVDLHATWPAERNSRYTNLSTKQSYRNRQGVYVHFTIPRVYRANIPDAKDPDKEEHPEVPTRWLIVRKIDDMNSVEPAEAAASGSLKEFTAWILESDRLSKIDDIADDEDIQVQYAPFINAVDSSTSLKEQAEVFIGKRTNAMAWSETVQQRPSDFVQLNLLGTSNEIFADYQPHCSNVFSMLDNFEYAQGKYLTKAVASYYIIGWHAKGSSDLFHNLNNQTREARLSQLNMNIKGVDDKTTDLPPEIKMWLEGTVSTNSLAHGTIYGVCWDVKKRPNTVPAERFGKVLQETLPVGVGTSPMDSIMTYVSAHQDLQSGENYMQEPQENNTRKLYKALRSLESYLMARDDGVESQLQAVDMLYNWNYMRLSGGDELHIAGQQSKSTDAEKEALKTAVCNLNMMYRVRDVVLQRKKQLQRRLFAEWWKYVILSKDDSKSRQTVTKNKVIELLRAIKEAEDKYKTTESSIDEMKAKYPTDILQPGTLPPYYQQRDPTILIGGIRSGWQPDFLDSLAVRLDTQITKEAQKPVPSDPRWIEIIKHVIPTRGKMAESAIALMREFVLTQNNPNVKSQNPIRQELPLYHDHVGQNDLGHWRDRFNETQPWAPLFLEWEVEYIHCPDNQFVLDQTKSSHQENEKLHYIIKPGTDLEELNKDIDKRNDRKFSGRVLILPQPAFSLETKVTQLFSDTPDAILEKIISKENQALLKDHLRELAFLSAPLAGFTSALKTVDQGNHVKPILTKPDTGEGVPINEALRPNIAFDKAGILSIGHESDVTPYGNSRTRTSDHTLFKPMTHGQFKFTQLNIIDKFGQSISAIDPTPTQTPQRLWPCITDWFKPQSKEKLPGIPNVIDLDDEHKDRCEWIQIPPQINQPARLNSVFVMPNRATEKDCIWRSANEFDNPIWGWVVVNYANYGIQLFLKDGTFYREVRLGGPNGTLDSPEWLPFAPPKQIDEETSASTNQLLHLVQALTTVPGYLTRFVHMINLATKGIKAPPSAYAEFVNALVGRPLALTHIGWSLELESEAEQTQADNDEDEDAIREKPLSEYNFKVKIGDRDRTYDGLVGYFKQKETEKTIGDALVCDEVFSHFSQAPQDNLKATGKGAITPIDSTNYIPLTPFWIDPVKQTPRSYALEFNKKLHVVGAIVDPFTPVHAYSGILPIKETRLAPWTWQSSMDKMKAFFHAGPVLVATDVTPFVQDRALTAGKPLEVVQQASGEQGVSLPSISTSQWAWLQPYWREHEKLQSSMSPLSDTNGASTDFMALAIDTADEKARFEEGPYTALEGYLQLITAPNEQQA